MSFFGMGAWEMMIILVAALVIFGPGKLPEVAGQAGRAVRDFRRMTSELSGEFEKTIAEVTDTKGTLGNDLKGMANQVNSVTNSVKKDLNKTTGTGSKTAAKSTAKSTPAKSTTTSTTPKSTTTSAASRTTAAASSTSKASGASSKATAAPPAPKVPTKADPLADLFFSEEDTLPASTPARPAAAAPKPRTSSQSSTSAPSADQSVDAVARARQRRLSAGYNSHRTP